MCESCNGLGSEYEINIKKLIPDDSLSINNGGIVPIGKKTTHGFTDKLN